MGDWTVLNYWNGSSDGYHDTHEDFTVNGDIARYGCAPVVEEHQLEADPKAPEFTIAVSYQSKRTAALRGDGEASKPGWKWSICWTGKHSSGRQMRTGYGFARPELAREAAKLKADEIAMSELPEEVFTYTPEI